MKMANSAAIPSTGIPKRIGAIYGRRPNSQWSEKEIKAYKQIAKKYDVLLCPISQLKDDVNLIEAYYKSERKKGDKGIYRRDLLTLLNNWNGELDRAREWNARVKSTKGFTEKKEIGTATEEDFKKAGAEAKQLIESLRAQLRLIPDTQT